jgi:hypothetical protein
MTGATPYWRMTDEEIAQLDKAEQSYARRVRDQRTREQACPGHEPVSYSTWEETRRGWHRMRCKHCSMDMSVDSGG